MFQSLLHHGAPASPRSSSNGRKQDPQIIPSRLLATSVSRRNQMKATITNGPLCQYRKGFFDHLKPKPFVLSAFRVTTQQGTLIMANFITEQLDADLKRQEKVKSGELSQPQADEQAVEWEKVEWQKRWTGFREKVFVAFAKYHAITFVMRVYELIADQFYDKVTMDKLTMDPFSAAMKISARSDSDTKVAKQMLKTTFWANMIAFMADYSVHQAILCYGYYIIVRDRRRRINNGEERDEEGFHGALMTSVMKKSTQLMISRGFGLVCSSIGGAVGTVVWPGWGTLLFSNMGEGASG
eukprot:scaffold26871_cov147-Cylindrotheca_fusiformis.AAC.4